MDFTALGLGRYLGRRGGAVADLAGAGAFAAGLAAGWAGGGGGSGFGGVGLGAFGAAGAGVERYVAGGGRLPVALLKAGRFG